MSKLKQRLVKLFYEILKIDAVRNYYCWLRYQFLKSGMRIAASQTSGVGIHTVDHNKAALDSRAGFGMANRMSLLLYPTAASLRHKNEARVLIVGPRTEDDIFWAKSLGLMNVRGLDLFSYSKMIDVGDMHQTQYAAESFVAVILGWVISYSSEPERLIAECKRIVRPGGYIGIGIESNPEHRRTGQFKPPRVNALNSARDIAAMVMLPVMFVHDPELNTPTDNAVIFHVA